MAARGPGLVEAQPDRIDQRRDVAVPTAALEAGPVPDHRGPLDEAAARDRGPEELGVLFRLPEEAPLEAALRLERARVEGKRLTASELGGARDEGELRHPAEGARRDRRLELVAMALDLAGAVVRLAGEDALRHARIDLMRDGAPSEDQRSQGA